MTDVALSFACLGIGSVVFGLLQTLGLRKHRPRRILCYLLGVYLASAGMTTSLSAVWFRPLFSSEAVFYVAITGMWIAGFFAAGLYAFLGPATADRSCTAHFLMLLRAQADHSHDAQRLIDRFDGRAFMRKRFKECLQARLICWEDGHVSLTDKGRCVARLYAAQLSSFHLDQRHEFDDPFRLPTTSEVRDELDELVALP